MADIVFESDYTVTESRPWLEERTEPFDQLDRIFDYWLRIHESWPATPEKFFEWLQARSVQVGGPEGDKPLTGCTYNFESFLRAEFVYTLFTLGDDRWTWYVAISWGVDSRNPSFYQLNDEWDDFLTAMTNGTVWCAAEHVFDSDNAGNSWQHYDRESSEVGERFEREDFYPYAFAWRDHDLSMEESDTPVCPVCSERMVGGETR